MRVHCTFITGRDGGSLYACTTDNGQRGPLWLLCAPGLEESIFARPVLQSIARAFAAQGRTSTLFDYTGDGHSEPSIAEIDLDRWVQDCVDVSRASIGDARPEGIIGIRLGAQVAIDAAHELAPRCILLCDPVIDGESWLADALRQNLTTQLAAFGKIIETRNQMLARVRRSGGSINVLGYELCRPFIDSVSRLSIERLECPEGVRVVIFRTQPPETDTPTPKPLAEFARKLRAEIRTVSGRRFWSESSRFEPDPRALIRELMAAGGVA